MTSRGRTKPAELTSPNWHGDVLQARIENPSSKPRLKVDAAIDEVKERLNASNSGMKRGKISFETVPLRDLLPGWLATRGLAIKLALPWDKPMGGEDTLRLRAAM